MLIIDSHAHIGFSHKQYPLYLHTLDEMVKIMDKFKITKSCVSSLKAIQYDFKEGNSELKKEIAKFPHRFIPFCVVHPRYWDEAKDELIKCVKEWKWKGLKLHPVDQCYPADCLSVKEIVEIAEELNIPIAIHSSMDDFSHPKRIGNLAREFPGVTFIMVHMGKMLYWTDALEEAIKYDNIILDTTDAMFADGLVETCVKRIGAQRIVCGTNLPISYPGPNLKRIEIAKIKNQEKELIFGKNMERILGGILMALKWGIIGAGLISERNMIPAMIKAENTELIAIMDVDGKRAKEISQKFSISKFYLSEEELLEDKDIDAVYIATPSYLHAKQVIKAAEHSKHILCEKPMALTLKDCEKMLIACERNNVKLSMGFMMRFHPYHLKAKEIIETKIIGEIIKVRAQWNFWYPPKDGLWRQDLHLGGGGCLMDVGIHCVDLLRFLVGEIDEVVALMGNVIFQYPVEDISTLLLKFKKGEQGIIDNSFSVDSANSLNGIEIYGTKGVIITKKTISCFAGGTMTTLIGGKEERYPASKVDVYQKEIEDFVSSIKNKRKLSVEGKTGLHALKIVLAGYESAKLKKTVRIL